MKHFATRLYNSSSLRIYLVYALVFSLSVFILFSFFYWLTIGYLQQQARDTVNTEISILEKEYNNVGFQALTEMLEEYISNQKPGDPAIYLLRAGNRTLLGNLDRWPTVSQGDDEWLDFKLDDRDDGKDDLFRAMARSVKVGDNLWLLVGHSMKDLQRVHENFIKAMLSGLLMLGGLALGGGLIMRSMVTRRLNEINRTSRVIMRGNIDERIKTYGTKDGFDQLASNLNDMLDEIQLGMNNVRRVSDNIAHDLKTPLSRIKNRLEGLRVHVSGDQVAEKTVNQISSQVDGLLDTFNALLRIGGVEATQKKENFKKTNLVDILNDVHELYGPLVEESGMQFEFHTVDSIPYEADRNMLFQAITNLIDNAIKFTPEGGKITLSGIKVLRKGYRIVVSDTGPGIPPEEYQNVSKRFYRLDTSRTTPGSGLGLALVSAIAQLHEMELEFKPNNPGLCAELIIPRK